MAGVQPAVIGMAQYQVNAAEYANNVQKNSSDLTARYVWAGIDGGEWGKVTGGRVSSGVGASGSVWICSVVTVSGWVGSAFFFPGIKVRIATIRITTTRSGIRNFNTISTGDGLCFLLRVLPLREDPL